jgi:membrane protein implicated in regulation of membrane protease activity
MKPTASGLIRWGLLAAVAVLTPLAALLPLALQRLAAMPMGLAVAWLGYSLFSERQERIIERYHRGMDPR